CIHHRGTDSLSSRTFLLRNRIENRINSPLRRFSSVKKFREFTWRMRRCSFGAVVLLAFALRYDAETSAASNPIGFKIVVIHGEDGHERFARGQMHECRISKIHWAVVILLHQFFQTWQLGIVDAEHGDRAGVEKAPRGIQFRLRRSKEMEKL